MPIPLSIPIPAAALCLVLAGCGGDQAVDAAVAEELAARADAVAEALAAGDGCTALELTAELESATASARDTGNITDAVAAEVLTAAQRIDEGTTCDAEPAASPPDVPDDGEGDADKADEAEDGDEAAESDDDDDHPGRGQGRGRGNDDD